MENEVVNQSQPTIEPTQDTEAQRILDEYNGVVNRENVDNDNHSQEEQPTEQTSEQETKLYAGKYKDIDSLKDGIKNINPDIAEYLIDGLNDEGLEKLYRDEEKKFSSNKRNEPRRNSVNKDKEEETKEETTTSVSDLWSGLQEEYFSNGGISDETYDAFEKSGIPSDIVDDYADKFSIQESNFKRNAIELMGGEEEFNSVIEWANEKYPDVIDELDSSYNFPQILLGLEGLKARYDRENGITESRRIVGKGNSSSSDGFAKKEDYIQAVSDAKYTYDEAYRKEVDYKLSKSNF